jgi:hypothetical protein
MKIDPYSQDSLGQLLNLWAAAHPSQCQEFGRGSLAFARSDLSCRSTLEYDRRQVGLNEALPKPWDTQVTA